MKYIAELIDAQTMYEDINRTIVEKNSRNKINMNTGKGLDNP